MPSDIITDRNMPRSSLRHRPIAPDTTQTQVQTPRASRARHQGEPYSPDESHVASPSPTHAPRRIRKASRRWLIYLVLGGLLAMVLLWLGQILWSWGQKVSDDIHYGYPRTTQVDRYVGHEVNDQPSHFIATNVKGQIYIIEIPGGQPNNSRLLLGPHLIGEGSDLSPVFLSFVGDPQHPDLLVTTDGIQVRFHNTGSAYAPM
jgi:hypothetical protein